MLWSFLFICICMYVFLWCCTCDGVLVWNRIVKTNFPLRTINHESESESYRKSNDINDIDYPARPARTALAVTTNILFTIALEYTTKTSQPQTLFHACCGSTAEANQ